MKIQLLDHYRNEFWYVDVGALPSPGDRLVIAQAPMGVHHQVESLWHHVGMHDHRVVVYIKRLEDDSDILGNGSQNDPKPAK